jgi:hypothetical protein
MWLLKDALNNTFHPWFNSMKTYCCLYRFRSYVTHSVTLNYNHTLIIKYKHISSWLYCSLYLQIICMHFTFNLQTSLFSFNIELVDITFILHLWYIEKFNDKKYYCTLLLYIDISHVIQQQLLLYTGILWIHYFNEYLILKNIRRIMKSRYRTKDSLKFQRVDEVIETIGI